MDKPVIHKPVIRKRHSLSPIWILPLVALCIGGWLLYTNVKEAGIEITVHFKDATGITPGKTKVIVKGIPVGTVKRLAIDDGMQGVNLIITMERQTRSALVEDTAFWIVKPEVSAGRISGLDTLFGGAYISVRKGSSTNSTTRFEGLAEQPPLDITTPGLHVTLETNTLYSLQRGSNIYAKNLQIGYLEDYALQENGKILLKAYIEPRYTHLIHTGTRFWNASGLSLTGDVQSGLTVNVGSLASLIYGGIKTRERHEKALKALENVGLGPRADHMPNQLSGGQRQRVAIARALILQPRILLLDEPTSALDVSVQAEILNLLTRLRRELGLTMLMVSHDLAVIAHLCERIGVMSGGELLETTTANALAAGNVSHPYTQALLRSNQGFDASGVTG